MADEKPVFVTVTNGWLTIVTPDPSKWGIAETLIKLSSIVTVKLGRAQCSTDSGVYIITDSHCDYGGLIRIPDGVLAREVYDDIKKFLETQ